MPGKPKTGPSLFGDDPTDAVTNVGDGMDDADLDAALPEVDDDWIIDDVGGGLRDEPEIAKNRDGLVKEMGATFSTEPRSLLTACTVSITKAQPPFQPASTPLENRKRYLGKESPLFCELLLMLSKPSI